MPAGGLEELRQIFEDDRLLICPAKVEQIRVADDRSECFVHVRCFPDSLLQWARMTWDATGPDAGSFTLPVVGDLVLVGYIDGHEDEAVVIRRFSSKEDTIPPQALDGDTVFRALFEKEIHLLSDKFINLGRGGAVDPAEFVVLGNTFKTVMSDFMLRVSNFMADYIAHSHIANLGAPTSKPDNAASVTADKAFVDAKKASPIDDELFLSDVARTEK